MKAGLRVRADPSRAAGMQAYMKSAMPCLGVSMPEVRTVCREVFREHRLESFAEWEATSMELWRSAGYREERYAALELTGHRLYRAYQVPAALGMYEEMIVTGAWWDLVDPVATHLVGPMARSHRTEVERVLRRWCRAGNPWLRRSAIIAQVSLKELTNMTLLAECIEPNLGDRDFFIRKAIGWALRSYARVNPEFVREYVRANESRLSGLSRREALKKLM